jgi:prepilin-type processing-associated H-X9-DG protein
VRAGLGSAILGSCWPHLSQSDLAQVAHRSFPPWLLVALARIHEELSVTSSKLAAAVGFSPAQYGANLNLMNYDHFTVPPPAPIKLASVQAIANTYMFMDAGVYGMSPGHATAATVSNNQYLPGIGEGGATNCTQTDSFMPSDCRSGRHFGGVSMAFADGHAKWLKTSTVYLRLGATALFHRRLVGRVEIVVHDARGD